jgi:hypothetical protein
MTRPATINPKFIIAMKREIKEQANKRGASAKRKKKWAKESTYSKLENVLFAWFQQAQAPGMHVDGTILQEKSLKIAATMGIENFSTSKSRIS